MLPELVTPFAEWCAAAIELMGVGILLVASAYALLLAGYRIVRRTGSEGVLQAVRHRLGRGILLGLEFLVAADIIHTVAVELTYETVLVLAVVVLVRTFLAFTLELEITGR